MIRRVLVLSVCLSLVAAMAAIAQPVETDIDLTPDNSEVRLFVSIDGRILEITVPDGGTADPDDPIGTGWVEVHDTLADATGDMIFSPDGNLNFSLPDSNSIGRTSLDGSTVDSATCADPSCEPAGLAINYFGDLLAVDGSDTGGLLRWDDMVGLCSDGINPAGSCYLIGSGGPSGYRVAGSDTLPGDWQAIQEWYSGELASIQSTSSTGGPGKGKKGGGGGGSTSLLKSAEPAYLSQFKVGGIDKDAADLAITQGNLFYAAKDDIVRVDLTTGDSDICASISGKVEARYVSGDVGGILYVASVAKKEIMVHRIDYSMHSGDCGNPQLLKKFLTREFGKNLGGLASTYSTLHSGAAIADDGATRTFVTMPDGMHKYRYTGVCEEQTNCELFSAPALSQTALAAIESSADPDNPDVPNDSRGLPFNLPGQGFPWEYESHGFAGFTDPYIGDAEVHEFATERTGTNFRLSCCPQSCAGFDCTGNAPYCEFGALIYALPISSEIVPDPRGTKRGRGSFCYESLTSTQNSNLPAEWCGWNSPLVPTPEGVFDVNAFFCGGGVTLTSHGGNVPVKFDVGAAGDVCTSSNAPPYDLRVLFSAGLVGYCAGGTFMPADVVEPVVGIMPSGEGTLDPATGQVLFAKAGPKKQYHFNFDTGQIPLSFGSVRTIVLINATFLEDSIEEGDQSVYLALDP